MKITRRLEQLRRTEHSSTVEIIGALVICEREKAFRELGYSSLWVYLVEGLQYSQAAASRRYRAMRCASRFPQVIGMLRDHRVSLSSLSKVESLLGQVEDPAGLLERICGKSQVQVERVIAAEFPRERPVKEFVRREFVKARAGEELFGPEMESSVSAVVPPPPSGGGTSAAEVVSPVVGPSRAEVVASQVATPRPVAEERVVLRTSLTPERFEALERARAIYSRKNPVATVEDLLNELVDHYLAAKAPKKRKEWKAGKAQKAGEASESAIDVTRDPQASMSGFPEPRSATPAPVVDRATPDPEFHGRSRHIPAAIRDEVMLRDGERCTFRSEFGRRCTATQNLQIDHVRPFARGGDHSPDNLRVLCAAHNRYEAERVFGKWTPPRRRNRRPEVEPDARGS